MAVAFAVIFWAHVEKQLLATSPYKPLLWKRFIDDIFSVCTISEQEINNLVAFIVKGLNPGVSVVRVVRHKYHPLTPQYHNDSEDDDRLGCRKVSHCHQQFLSELHSPGRSHYTNYLVAFVNNFDPAIKFTCEMSSDRIVFLNTKVFRGPRFAHSKTLDVTTHFKPTETFQYTHFSSCHPLSVKMGLIKGETLRLLITSSAKENFELLE